MKYSQFAGSIASLLIIGICFLPWIEVPAVHLLLSGWHGEVNEELNFGKQGIPYSFLCGLMIVLFQIPRVWAKRANIVIAVLNLGWTIKNYLIFSMCRLGECPVIKPALYFLVLLALIIQVMTFLPKMEIKEE
jgi:hypothetical protein